MSYSTQSLLPWATETATVDYRQKDPAYSNTLTTTKAAPLSAFIASFSAPQGLFYAKLSAASAMAILPILILGWFSQKQLVRGLTFGAVK